MRYRAEVASPWSGEYLHRDVRLPGVHPFDDAFCDGRYRYHHDTALNELSAELNHHAPGARPVLTRMDLLPDPPRDGDTGQVVIALPVPSAA